jgi:hypothetical protein
MAQSVLLKAAGLYTFPHELSEVPQGALNEALNVIINRNSILELRRGFKQYTQADLSALSKQLFNYKDRVLVHHGSTLSYDSDENGTFSDFSGSYAEPESGIRIKGIEANGNFYFTTDKGIRKMSASSASDFTTDSNYILDSGGVKAVEGTASVNYSSAGFLSANNSVAYRIVWGITDNNSNLILGAPSSRFIVTNASSTNSAYAELTFPVPSEIIDQNNTDYFYQIYRTGLSTSSNTVGDEMNLVIEDFVTGAEITAGQVNLLEDVTPDSIRASGTLLYTNPVSGEGIAQANELPPIAKDITLYKSFMFYSNIQTRQRLFLDILATDDFSDGDFIKVTDGTITRTYTLTGTQETYTATFHATNADYHGNYLQLVSANDETKYKIWFEDTGIGTATEPTLANSVSIKVDITGAASANDIALATKNAIEGATFDFIITPSGGTSPLTIACSNNGAVVTAISETIAGAFSLTKDGNGTGEDTSTQKIFLPRTSGTNAPSPSQQLDQIAKSMVRVFNADTSGLTNAYIISGATSIVPSLLIESRNIEDPEFFIIANDSNVGKEFNPSMGTEDTGTAATGTGTVTITATSHGLVNGDEIIIYDSGATVPDITGKYTISNKTTNTFDISTTVTSSGTVTFAKTSVNSDNEVRPNRLMYSKFQQPEAVPITNFIDVGARDKQIQRIVALRDSLFIFKEDGIFRLSGEFAPFSVSPFDSSAILQSPDSAVVLNNMVYALSTQGVITVTDTGVSVISRPIEDKILDVTRDGFSFRTASFGVAYETDRAYLLWTVSVAADTVATQCFRYDSFTTTWTRWDISKTCGIVNSANDKMYLGASDSNILEIERKSKTRTDYADREFVLQVIQNQTTDNIVKISTSQNIDTGDTLVQTQYLTISQFHRLLKQLDDDPTLDNVDYYSSLQMVASDSMNAKMIELATKLTNDDSTRSYSFPSTSDFATMQSQFNDIIDDLNTSAGVFFTTYTLSEGTVEFEGRIESFDQVNSLATIPAATPLLTGPITQYKSIKAKVDWQPQYFQDPSMLKQVSEGTLLFENNNFHGAIVSYGSDLSPSFIDIEFDSDGLGDFGQFNWGNTNWGGVANARPLRTLIPREKQRCRHINVRFQHQSARENFGLLGLSLTYRPISTRGYR